MIRHNLGFLRIISHKKIHFQTSVFLISPLLQINPEYIHNSEITTKTYDSRINNNNNIKPDIESKTFAVKEVS